MSGGTASTPSSAHCVDEVRELFADFEQSIGKPAAYEKLREAIDAAMEVIDGDHPDDAKRIAKNIGLAHWRLLSRNITMFLAEGGARDTDRCIYFMMLIKSFTKGLGLKDDPILKGQGFKLMKEWLVNELPRLSDEDQDEIVALLKADNGPNP
jgi:hypothetical protein